MTTFTLNELCHGGANGDLDWQAVWHACTGPVYRVVDEDGNNMADAEVRHFHREQWLYVDSIGGFGLFDAADARGMLLADADDE
jgi:hypothetical protein